MVPRVGLEPTSLSALVFETSMFTNFIIWGLVFISILKNFWINFLTHHVCYYTSFFNFVQQLFYLMFLLSHPVTSLVGCRGYLHSLHGCFFQCYNSMTASNLVTSENIKLVSRAGLEPAHLAARDFKSLVSTYFTIWALTFKELWINFLTHHDCIIFLISQFVQYFFYFFLT